VIEVLLGEAEEFLCEASDVFAAEIVHLGEWKDGRKPAER
jgi:hypothetical protein